MENHESQETQAPQPGSRPGWRKLPPQHLPKPTYMPAMFALGVTLFFWGFITSWVIFVAGVILLAVSLGGWIWDIKDERKHH